jgi:RNA polymerase sigma-70 factor (ECF subfamily)
MTAGDTAGGTAGDEQVWDDLVREHQEAVFRLAYLMLGDADDAEDVAQETFINAYRARHRFDPSRPIRPWLMSICANLARNRRRSLGRYFAALRRLLAAQPEPITVAEHGIKSIDAQALWQAVRRLSHTDQEVIYLRYFLDLPEAEMAIALDVAHGTIKSRLHRALGRLRDVVQKEFPGLGQEFEPE